ncbi:unnamed protein product [Cuscuta campestris]|uniref:Uncharacterized protein n=1 Tax=Cuscuta campestris TaxID=132261 RepID=A0A484KQM0_9ASTE|nr:unnamed protein product [Cuscuta campestris]
MVASLSVKHMTFPETINQSNSALIKAGIKSKFLKLVSSCGDFIGTFSLSQRTFSEMAFTWLLNVHS